MDLVLDSWRLHAFFTTTGATLTGTVAADRIHRQYAIIEQLMPT